MGESNFIERLRAMVGCEVRVVRGPGPGFLVCGLLKRAPYDADWIEIQEGRRIEVVSLNAISGFSVDPESKAPSEGA